MNKAAITIGILECGSNRKEWLDAHGDFADWFKPFLLSKADRPVVFKVYQAHQDVLPGSIDDADVWLLTGSPISVYDEPAWQIQLTKFLRKSMLSKPIIGVCYGHQLLHHMLGGKVEKMPQWGIGAHTYEVIAQPNWLTNQPENLTLLASHQDQVTLPATETTLLATSKFCPNAITRIGSNIITVQAHPELTKLLAKEAYEYRRQDQGAELTDQALISLDAPLSDEVFCEWIFNFVDLVLTRQSRSAIAS